jgi:AAA domain
VSANVLAIPSATSAVKSRSTADGTLTFTAKVCPLTRSASTSACPLTGDGCAAETKTPRIAKTSRNVGALTGTSYMDDSSGLPITPASAAIELRQLISVRAQAASQRWPRLDVKEIRRMLRGPQLTLSERVALGFLLCDLLAKETISENEPSKLRTTAGSLYVANVMVIRSRHLSKSCRLAALRTADILGRMAKVPQSYRVEIRRRTEEFADADYTPDWSGLFGKSITEQDVTGTLSTLHRATSMPSPIPYPSASNSGIPTSADLLAEAADRQSASADISLGPAVKYNMSDQDLRLDAISLRGFRGAPLDLTVRFASRGSTGSTIIFGENGVGKSTIVDAIEFALQGRIGRSSYFDSPLLPSVRYLGDQVDAWTQAELSDGTNIERRTVVANGQTDIVPQDVRPGFRLAPISIKRSDILRFLDTDALERGSTFLDYFPASAGQLAVRPEEKVHKLQAETAELRIQRSTLASKLSNLIPVSEEELTSRDKFDNAVRKHVMRGLPTGEFSAAGGWDTVDEPLRELVSELSEVHKRLGAVKRRTEQTTQIFNPVAHRRQLAILQTVLRDVGSDISDAFIRIATEYPINRIEVVFGASSTLSLDIVITLDGGLNCFPQQIFSEAYQDLLALLFFTSVAKEASKRGQSRILIMDDVLQSIDSNVRHAFVDYILSDFGGWQLIFTTHDRLWKEQLRDLFDAYQHRFTELAIYDWGFGDGPRLSAELADPLSRDLISAISSGEPRTIGALAGQLLEVICDQLTRRLHLKVARTSNDEYTLGVLWPAVREWLSFTTRADIAQQITTHRYLRNLTVHADISSFGLSLRDARAAANAVLALYRLVRCDICGSWIKGQKQLTCTCGALSDQFSTSQ